MNFRWYRRCFKGSLAGLFLIVLVAIISNVILQMMGEYGALEIWLKAIGAIGAFLFFGGVFSLWVFAVIRTVKEWSICSHNQNMGRLFFLVFGHIITAYYFFYIYAKEQKNSG